MPKASSNKLRNVYVVDGARTPFLKDKHKLGPFSASDLAVNCGKALLARQPFKPTDIGEVIIGCIMPSPDEANIARVISLRLGCGKDVPAWTVQRNCATGMQALDNATRDIATGRHDLVLAGGTEAMTRAPILFKNAFINWLSAWYAAKSKGIMARGKVMLQWRPHLLAPVFSLIRGLSDPIVGLSMGQTAENIAYHFNLSRGEMDQFAVESHQFLAKAQDAHYFDEIIPLYDTDGQVYEVDDGLRRDTTMEQLSKLNPRFDAKFGMVTAGNSAQITDGAALLLLASEDAVNKYKLPILGRIVDTEWAGLEPEEMGLGPVYASSKLLQRYNLSAQDIDYWEINEAFAGQVLGCLAAFENEHFCQERLGLKTRFGSIPRDKLNVDGGAIALGHPVGTSGARLVLHLFHVLRRQKAKRGIATLCIGGGQGGAMLIEAGDSHE